MYFSLHLLNHKQREFVARPCPKAPPRTFIEITQSCPFPELLLGEVPWKGWFEDLFESYGRNAGANTRIDVDSLLGGC